MIGNRKPKTGTASARDHENGVTIRAGVPQSARNARNWRACVWTPVRPSSLSIVAITSGTGFASDHPLGSALASRAG
jgi:hypothetical protein